MKCSLLCGIALCGLLLVGGGRAQASPGCDFVNAGGFNHTDTFGKYPDTNPVAFSHGDQITLNWNQGPPASHNGYGRIDIVTPTNDWVAQFVYVDPDKPSATGVVTSDNSLLSLTYIIAKGSSTTATCRPAGY
jgi:hypothetical protein